MSDQNPEELGTVADGDEVPASEEEVTQDPAPINPEEAEEELPQEVVPEPPVVEEPLEVVPVEDPVAPTPEDAEGA
jgi:hypothetical protein